MNWKPNFMLWRPFSQATWSWKLDVRPGEIVFTCPPKLPNSVWYLL